MISYAVAAFLFAASATAQSTTTATILLPDWCVTQSSPTVTVLGTANALTTYSYSCTENTSKVSAAQSRASDIAASAHAKASAQQASLGVSTKAPNNRMLKRDNDCYNFDAFEACIPWEITQGANTWAVHYTGNGVSADEECTFGDGGVSNGPATCTGSGHLDPNAWGNGDGTHTETFAKTEVDTWWIRNTVSVTLGGKAAATTGASASTSAAPSTITSVLTNSAGTPTATVVTAEAALSTGLAPPLSVPTGAIAMAAGAGGILAAALAL